MVQRTKELAAQPEMNHVPAGMASFQAILTPCLKAALSGPEEAGSMSKMLFEKIQASGLEGDVFNYCAAVVTTLHALALELKGVAELERQIAQRVQLSEANPEMMQ